MSEERAGIRNPCAFIIRDGLNVCVYLCVISEASSRFSDLLFPYSIGGADRLCCFMNIVILSYILSLNSLAPPQVQKFHVLF